MKELIMISCILLGMTVLVNGSTDTSLWDQIVKQEQVALTVIYHGRSLNVWRQDSHGYSRFYVTPLCVIDLNSIECIKDEYSTENNLYIFAFDIKLWDFALSKAVKRALKRKNIDAKMYDILPLPMQQIRIGLENQNLKVQADKQWRSNQDQPHIMPFELYTNDEKFCNRLRNDAKNKTELFLRILKPYFEFTMVVGQTASRNLNITGKTLQKSSFYSNLVNKYSGQSGTVYLQSKDANKLAHEIFNKVAFNEEVSSDYIESNQEKDIINELINIFKEQKVLSNELSKEEWDTVFWDDIFTRPDIQTEYFNQVLKYDETENNFKFNKENEKEFRSSVEKKYSDSENVSGGGGFSFGLFGINASGTTANSQTDENRQESENVEKDVLKFDDLNKAIKKDMVNVKWTGEKFEPKNLDLFRLSVKELNSANEIYFKRVIVKKFQSTQKIEIKAETNSSSLFDNLYDEESTIATTAFSTTTSPKTTTATTTSTTITTVATTTVKKPKTCPYGWELHIDSGFCYKVFTEILWHNGNSACKALDANLASVHDWDELFFIMALSQNANVKRVLIGLSEIDGIWQWTDSTPMDFLPWSEYEPKKGRSCSIFIIASSKFVSVNCNDTGSYVCKKLPS